MMGVALRVIPCLDVKARRVVKGINFKNLRDSGDPVELAVKYSESGADEIIFLDISASVEGRATMAETVLRCSGEVFVPLTVGGGIRKADDVDKMLRSGADKVGVNTAAINNPQLIDEVARIYGNQVLVISVDARRCPPGVETKSGFELTTHGGKKSTAIDALEWVHQVQERGAGEILLNSMDADGMGTGFDLEMLAEVRAKTSIPLIASGGGGKISHFVEAARIGADAVLAASVFHFGILSIAEVKRGLAEAGFTVRK